MRFAHVLTAVSLAAVLVGAPHVFAEPKVIGPNPIPERIKTGPIKVALEDVVRLPASMKAPPSKPHFLAPALDGSGRLFVADQYSRLFVILRDGRLRDWPAIDMYLWLKPHFMSGIREGGFSGFAIHPDAARAGPPGLRDPLHGAYGARGQPCLGQRREGLQEPFGQSAPCVGPDRVALQLAGLPRDIAGPSARVDAL